MYEQDRRKLTGDCKPSQPHLGFDAQVACAPSKFDLSAVGHVAHLSRRAGKVDRFVADASQLLF